MTLAILGDASSIVSESGRAVSAITGVESAGTSASGHLVTPFGAIATAAAAAGTALGAFAVAGIKQAGDLQQAVANISTIKPEIDTTEVFNALNEMQRR